MNNGKPKMSCKEPVKKNIIDEAKFYIGVFFAISAITFTSLVILIVFLIYRCVKVCKGNKSNSKPKEKQRAANGMVVGDDDFDEIPGKQVEMTNIPRRASAYDQRKNAVKELRNDLAASIPRNGNQKKPTV